MVAAKRRRANSGGVVQRDGIWYSMLPSQRKFHEIGARFKGFSGPIGSGKSQALCREALVLSYQNPGRLGLIAAPTYPMLRDATQTTLFEIMDGNDIPYQYNKAENTLLLTDVGSRIIFRPSGEVERLRGTNLAWFGLDEMTYTPEAAWLRLEGRLRDPLARKICGFGAWTPKGYDWVYRKFIAEPVPGYRAVIAQPYENRFILEKFPDYYERLRHSYDENLFRQEALGQYLNMQGGLVYSAFSRDANVRTLRVSPARPLLWAVDFNVDPMTSIVAQLEGDKILALDEIVLRHASTQEACEAFETRFPRHDAGLVIYGDASGNNRQTTGTTNFHIIKEFFRAKYGSAVTYKVPKANPVVRDRIMLTNSRLRSASGEIHLLIDPKCKELIKDFEQVAYKADSNAIDKDKDRARTHASDALGYLIWEECSFRPAIGEHMERLV
jgi:Terminase large subunit, T4likevirus-type, N-terminal